MPNWRVTRKYIEYGWDYFLRKFRPLKYINHVITLSLTILLLFTRLNGIVNRDFPFIPQALILLITNKTNFYLFFISLVIIQILGWFGDGKQKSKEREILADTIKDIIIPAIDKELNELRQKFINEREITENIRISLFVPTKINLWQWELQMVCRTLNIPQKELKASFALNEGVLGYAFLKNQKYCVEFVDVTDETQLPDTYKPLKKDNEVLINPKIKGVLVVAAFQEGSIAGLLAIDTESEADLKIMAKGDLNDDALDWIMERYGVVKILWRNKNDI
ncbi:hypothetical protein [Gloeocapsa sp. PCC 73106]|uniref:hypothetical protein n=1 Tax=Gloeocapsa sp. PCC 73106 TaxID=102232 RepID=UPI0002ACD47E|nr:hypothetical protein [Gloeocapsa sp. PCC 73106]ELR98892.1 hypothetical protein GLO73106DRAFT_00027310 [Gloeocapsa sp. PCC 73106]